MKRTKIPSQRIELLWLPFSLFLVAFILRIIFLLEDSHNPFFSYRFVDAFDYHQMGLWYAQGKWPRQEAFFRPPLYPLFLGNLYQLFGTNILTLKCIQLLLGSLSCVLVYFLAFLIFRKRFIAVCSSLICCFHGTLIYFDGQLLSANLEVFLILLSLVLLMLAARTLHKTWWIGSGLSLALASMNRGTFLLFLPPLLLWMYLLTRWISQKQWTLQTTNTPHFWQMALALLLPFGLTIAPLAWHNAKYDEKPTTHYTHYSFPQQRKPKTSPSSTLKRLVTGQYCTLGFGGGVNLYVGNNPDLKKVNAIDDKEHFSLFAKLLSEPFRQGVKTASGHHSYFMQKTFRYIRRHPRLWLHHNWNKFTRFFQGKEIPRGSMLYAHRQYSSLLSLLLWKKWLAFPSGLWIPLGLLGLLLSLHSHPREVSLLLIAGALQTLFVIAIFITARYRLPILPLFAIFSAFAVERLYTWLRTKQTPQLLLTSPLLILLLLGCNLQNGPMKEHAAFEYFNLANKLRRKGKSSQAIKLYLRALHADPNYSPARNTLGYLYLQQGHPKDGLYQYRETIRRNPQYVKTYYNLALFYLHKAPNKAESYLRKAIALRPNYTRAWLTLGQLLQRQKKPKQSILCFQKILEYQPHHIQANFSLMRLYSSSKQRKRAIFHAQRLLLRLPKHARLHYELSLLLHAEGHTQAANKHLNLSAQLGFFP